MEKRPVEPDAPCGEGFDHVTVDILREYDGAVRELGIAVGLGVAFPQSPHVSARELVAIVSEFQ